MLNLFQHPRLFCTTSWEILKQVQDDGIFIFEMTYVSEKAC
jgi:hypothetical protein